MLAEECRGCAVTTEIANVSAANRNNGVGIACPYRACIYTNLEREVAVWSGGHLQHPYARGGNRSPSCVGVGTAGELNNVINPSLV
jgi:hypothetical protein